ncbi:MAG TPA: hypothetical protein VF070_29885 [Streptosporangiaceae bacterium]
MVMLLADHEVVDQVNRGPRDEHHQQYIKEIRQQPDEMLVPDTRDQLGATVFRAWLQRE